MRRIPVRLGAALAVIALAGVALADEMAQRIRDQEKTYAKSIVWLKATVTDDEGDEGTSICSGPTVLHEGRTVIVAPDVPDQIKDLKILQADGKEVDAEVLAHDADIGFMFVAPKDPKGAAGALSPVEIGKEAKPPAIADPLLVIDRRSHAAPDETTCRLVRVNCVLTVPERLTFYTGLQPQQVGGLVVTPEGAIVGVVGFYQDRNDEGQRQRGVAVLPLEKVLVSLAGVQKPEPEEEKKEEKEDKKEEKQPESQP